MKKNKKNSQNIKNKKKTKNKTEQNKTKYAKIVSLDHFNVNVNNWQNQSKDNEKKYMILIKYLQLINEKYFSMTHVSKKVHYKHILITTMSIILYRNVC